MVYVPIPLARRGSPRPGPLRIALVLALTLGAAWWVSERPATDLREVALPSASASGDLQRLRAAFEERRGDLWVTLEGTLERTLKDDDEGSRHQRFIVRLDEDLTLLVAHNIDLAPRVPLRIEDRLRLCGRYEWNAQGGVLHWTHHDPQGGRGGWIELDGRRYE